MLDIEFLSGGGKVRSHLLHLFETGCFRVPVRDAVRQVADERGWLWQDLDLKAPALDAAGGLYDQVLIAVDLDALVSSPVGERTLKLIAQQIGPQKDTHFYLFGTGVGELSGLGAWDTVMNAATVLHEPRLGAATIPKLLAYLAPRLAVPLDVIGNAVELERAVRDWAIRDRLDLPEFLSRLEVVLSVSIEGGVFQPAAFEQATTQPGVSPVTWATPIARFLRARSDQTRLALLSELDRAYQSKDASPSEVMGAVWRATFDLVKCNEALNPGDGVVPDGWPIERWEANRAHRSLRVPILLRWQMMLAHHEPSLMGKGLVAWDTVLRQVQGVEKS